MLLDVEASNYILRVHRTLPGEPLQLFDPYQALEAEATLVGVRGKAALCRVVAIRATTAIPRMPLILLQSFAKGDKVDRVVKEATALGVTALVIVATQRSVVVVREDEGVHRRERWDKIAIEAARQCGRGDVPRIFGPLSLADAILAASSSAEARVVLSPDGAQTLSAWFHAHPPCPLACFIGPEGGLEESETALLVEAGYQAVRFTDFVLRTETAATAVLGAVAAWQLP